MAQIMVDKETLGNKRLKPLAGYQFLAKFPVCEVVMGEFSAAATTYPIFFIEREGSYTPMALLSLIDGQNVFVEEDGRWSGYYIPAAFRRYPFSVGPGKVNGQEGPVLLVDDEALSDSDGEPLFPQDDKDATNSPIGRALKLITDTDRSHAHTRTLVAELAALDLIRASDLTVTLEGQKHNIGGLWGIDEAKLGALPDEAFLKLRHSGALAMAHIQLQSVGQIQRLIQRHHLRDQAQRGAAAQSGPVD
jgi:hypothetical protein